MGGAWQGDGPPSRKQLPLHLEPTAVWRHLLKCVPCPHPPPSLPHLNANTMQLSGNSIGTFYLSQGSSLKEGILVGGIWQRGMSPAMRNPTSQRPLEAKPKS